MKKLLISLTLSLPLLCQAENFDALTSFGNLRTIAGKGGSEDLNSWISSYEGAHPKQVELSKPHDCGTDAWGRVYIVDKESHSVLRVSADGSTITTVAGTHLAGNGADAAAPATQVTLSNPNGLHVLADGTFYILDTDNKKIRRVSPSGVCTTILTHAPGFGAGRGLWVSDDQQTIYFCGGALPNGLQAVMKFSANGGVSEFAQIAPGTRGLGNIDVAPDGSVGITSVGAHRVYRVDSAGATPVVIAGNGAEGGGGPSGSPATSIALERVRGISFLPDGSFFLATQKGGDIWWVDLEGKIHLFVSGAGSGNVNTGDGFPHDSAGVKIAEPRSIHWASNGDLLIVCNDNGFIRAVNTTCLPTAPVISISENPLALSFSATIKGRYLLETSPDLTSASWTSSTALGSGENTTITHPLTLEGQRKFWRIRVPSQAGGN